jgi:outer membrane lipoprotein-sorting protein
VRSRSKFIWFALPLLALLCLGWADTWEGIRAAAEKLTSIQTDFVQQKHLPILAKPLVSKGVLYYQLPRSLRWEYTAPIRSILLMHDGRARRFVGGPSGFTEQKGAGVDAMQVVMEEITHWLAGRFDRSTTFAARLESNRRVVLTPKEAALAAIIQRIELQLAQRPGEIDKVTIFESADSYTELTFTNSAINQPIDPVIFQSAP